MVIAIILQPLVDACKAILEFWHGLLGDWQGSWGVSIILLTFTVRAAILPLTFTGVKSMQRMQQLQPELKRLQARYKDDRQRMNQEVMKFYQEHQFNPLSSCLPLLLQIPFFISLFYLLRSNAFKMDIKGNESFFFIHNLAEKVTDPVVLGVLIVLYIGTQLAASAVTALSADKNQRLIMFGLPFVFVFFIVNFQAGLILYWITTNVWTIGQQLLVRKLFPKPEPIGPRDDGDAARPARGKPTPDGGAPESAKTPAKASAKTPAKAAAGKSAGGNGRTAKPPPSPRKKKKRSGRRR